MMIELYELLNVIQKCKYWKISANLFENHFDDWAKCLFFTSNKHVYFMLSGIFSSGSDHPAVIDCEGDCVYRFICALGADVSESMVVISAQNTFFQFFNHTRTRFLISASPISFLVTNNKPVCILLLNQFYWKSQPTEFKCWKCDLTVLMCQFP